MFLQLSTCTVYIMIPCAYVKWKLTQCSLCRWKDPMLSTSTHTLKKSFSFILCFRICFSLQLRQCSVRNRTTNPLIMGRPALPLSHQCLEWGECRVCCGGFTLTTRYQKQEFSRVPGFCSASLWRSIFQKFQSQETDEEKTLMCLQK